MIPPPPEPRSQTASDPNPRRGRPPLRLLVTLGDPRGVGPEVATDAVAAFLREEPAVSVVLVGPEGHDPELGPYTSVGPWDGSEVGAGRVAGDAVQAAVDAALKDEADGVVTAPLHKPALKAAGYETAGHTEMLRERTGADPVGMLMVADRTRLGSPLRVLLATTHIPLRDVPDALTADLLVEQTLLLDRALRNGWALGCPRIALCALNPHASDQGLFGDEEARVYAPALERLLARNVDVDGPIPADTAFSRAVDGEFDAVVAPYHDVGMAAFKTLAFGRGVNVTLGLPFVRTSPDHGTAFDIAGTGVADSTSMLEALRTATRLARVRVPTEGGAL